MLTTNLLPHKEKRMIQLEEARRTVRVLTVGTVVMFLVGSVFLLPSYLPLALEEGELARLLTLEEQASRALGVDAINVELRNVQSRVRSLQAFLSEPQRASVLLAGFLETGTGVNVVSLNLKQDGSFSVNGVAATRRDLLDFEKALRDSGRFETLSSPLSNITRESRITFVIQGKLKSLHRL